MKMAYVSTETTRRVRGELKQRFPNLKFSVSKKDGTLRVRIMAGDLDFRDIWEDIPQNKQYWKRYGNPKPHFDGYVSINTSHPDDYNPKYTDLFKQIISIMKGTEWFDNSDPQIDYFSTAYYLKLSVGKWNKPYQYTGTPRMDDMFRRFRSEEFEAPKPQLTKNQMELLNHIKVSAFHGDGKDAYVKTDRKGWDGFKPQLVQKLLDKGIITIPKHYGRIESLKAYTVMLNPIAWEYPFKYDWDKSLKQKGNKIVRNKRIHREETARKLEEQRRRDNMTFDEVYAELFGAEEFEAQLSEYLYKCDACGHTTDVRFSDVYSDKYCREACARGRPEKCRGSCGKNGWDVEFTGVYHAGLRQTPSIDTKYGVNISCKDCGVGFYGDARWELYDELPDKSQAEEYGAEEFAAEWRGRWDVGNERKSGEDYYFTYYIRKTEANPQAFEVLIRGRSAEGRELIRQASKNPIFRNLRYADKIKIGFFIRNQINWEGNIMKGDYQVYLPKLVEGKRGKQVFQMTPSRLVVDNYGEPVIEGLYRTKQKAVNAIYYYFEEMEYPFHISNWPLEDSWEFNWDEEFEAEGEMSCNDKLNEAYDWIGFHNGEENLRKFMDSIGITDEDFEAEGEDMTLKDSAKLGFGLGAGMLGFRVALFGASALVGGLLLNRKE